MIRFTLRYSSSREKEKKEEGFHKFYVDTLSCFCLPLMYILGMRTRHKTPKIMSISTDVHRPYVSKLIYLAI